MRRKALINVVDTWAMPDWEDNSFSLRIKMGKPTVMKIRYLSARYLLHWMKKHCVGICTTNRNNNYFIPKMKIGKFTLSLQCGYYIWSKRDDAGINHNLLITEEEFNASVPNSDTLIDVAIWYRDKRLTSDQMTLVQVLAFLKELIYDGHSVLYI